MELAVLLLAVLIAIGVIARYLHARRAAVDSAESRPVRAPLWYREFLRHDFLDPAFRACTLRLEPGADHTWRMTVGFKTAHGAAISQVADPVHGPGDGPDGRRLCRASAGRWPGARATWRGGVNLRYVRAEGAPGKDPPSPDPGFDTARIKAAQNGHALQRAQISTLPAGDGRWRVSVGFFPAQANNGRANFPDPLTVPQIFKILADLKADGWRESRRIYYATQPGTTQYSGAISYVLSRK